MGYTQPPLLPPHRPGSPTRESGHSARAHLPSGAVTAKPTGFLHAGGARLQMRTEAWARDSAGTEHLAGWALWGWGGKQRVRQSPRGGPRDRPRPGHSPGQGCRLQSCHCSVSWAWHGALPGPSLQLRRRSMVPPPQGAEQLLQADQGPRAGHSWEGHARDPLTQVLGAEVCRKGSEPRESG